MPSLARNSIPPSNSGVTAAVSSITRDKRTPRRINPTSAGTPNRPSSALMGMMSKVTIPIKSNRMV